MSDRYAVIWTRAPGGPLKMGSLVTTGREMRFSYDAEFLARGDVPGLSLLLPPRLWGDRPYVHAVSEALPLLPRLMALIPARSLGNLQRRIYTGLLARRPTPPAPGFETDWELLLLAGRNGIGHVDVFRDDREALGWYRNRRRAGKHAGSRSVLWRFLKERMTEAAPEEAEAIMQLIGPTPSVGGQIPKLLVAIPDTDRWRGDVAPSGTRALDDVAFTDVVLKVEYPEYAGLSVLEALCYDVHRELEFETPRTWRAEIGGLPALAVERFDRSRAKTPQPIPMESFFSVYATGKRGVTSATDAELEQIGAMIAKLGEVCAIDVEATRREVYRRLLAAFFTGNGDLHLDNLSFLGGPKDARLAPVYDPAPMRAFARHDLLSALPFEIDDARGLRHSVARLGASFGLTHVEAVRMIDEIGEATTDYPKRVLALADCPADTRQALARRVEQTRVKLLGSPKKDSS
jgi:serine/threonine-protein kinase HipA